MEMNTKASDSHTKIQSTAYRDFTLLFASMFSLLAGAALSPALPEMATHFREVPNVDTLVKMTLSLTALFIALGSGLAGLLSDRFGRRNVLIAGAIVTGIAGTSAGLMNSLYLILGSRVLLGLGVAAVITTATTLIGDVFSPSAQAKFFGRQAAAMKIGGIVFLILGGVLASFGWRAAFLVDLLAFLILPGALSCFQTGRPRPRLEFLPGAPSPWTRRTLVASLVAAFASQLFFYMIPTQIPFYLARMAHANPREIGLAIAVNIAFGAFAASQFHRLNRLMSSVQLYVLSFLVMSVGYVMVALVSGFGGVLLALAVGGVGVGAIFPCATSCLVRTVGELQRGRVVGLLMTATFAGQFTSPLVLAPFVKRFGIDGAFLGAGAGLAVTAVCLGMILARQNLTVVPVPLTDGEH